MLPPMSEQPGEFAIRYAVPRWRPEWAIPDVPVSFSDLHDEALTYLRALLSAWVERTHRNAKVGRELGIRWYPHERRMGFDPDVCVLEPPPPDVPLTSVRTWVDGHSPPKLAVEVVSPSHPYKDDVDTPERCAACGVGELWVYDPLLTGPKIRGGPHLLQVWQRGGESFELVHAGSGPVRSLYLDAWLHPRATRQPREARLEISDDRAGSQRWLTRDEELVLTRGELLTARAEQRQIAAERDALLARLRELEGPESE